MINKKKEKKIIFSYNFLSFHLKISSKTSFYANEIQELKVFSTGKIIKSIYNLHPARSIFNELDTHSIVIQHRIDNLVPNRPRLGDFSSSKVLYYCANIKHIHHQASGNRKKFRERSN